MGREIRGLAMKRLREIYHRILDPLERSLTRISGGELTNAMQEYTNLLGEIILGLHNDMERLQGELEENHRERRSREDEVEHKLKRLSSLVRIMVWVQVVSIVVLIAVFFLLIHLHQSLL